MALLLDTNVVSAARRPDRQDEAFRLFLRDYDIGEAFISSVTLMEIRFGIQREEGRDPEFARDLTRWLDKIVLPVFDGRVLDFSREAALAAGTLPTAQKRPTADAMIAATALTHGLAVATCNVADFLPLGVQLVNPWTYSATSNPIG
ncbi:type II toxin-antitoxin system VapC family toxin [Novosphingobium resinovorum]|uniref:Ribonuclease VapC n=1 Tax=Novosphingobium resinovorum TaxID=158500 RepID=A0A1D8A6M2_9SPHN|nr:type II toxin-antitoxin system VapC family toxin [Novosphingobium resinovorum]AOR77763.1 nucleotide-binding protein [Novosphingobium resinovorum]